MRKAGEHTRGGWTTVWENRQISPRFVFAEKGSQSLMPYNFTAIEKKWQKYWLENKTFRALDPAEPGDMPKAYVLDMFPYPSGAGPARRPSRGIHRHRHRLADICG